MIGDDPGPFYLINTSLVIKHGISWEELNNLISWERDFLITRVEKEQIEKNKNIDNILGR